MAYARDFLCNYLPFKTFFETTQKEGKVLSKESWRKHKGNLRLRNRGLVKQSRQFSS